MLILNVAALPAQAHAVSSPLFTGWIIKVRSPEKTHLLSATQKLLFVYNLLTAVRLQLVSDFKPACLPSCVFRHKPAVNIWSGFDELVSRQVLQVQILSVIWSHCDLKKKQTKCEQIEKQFSQIQQHIRIQIQERQLNRAMSCIPLRVGWIIYRVLFFCMDFLMSGYFGISEPLNKQLTGQSEPTWHLSTECTREALPLLCLLLQFFILFFLCLFNQSYFKRDCFYMAYTSISAGSQISDV